jgi:ABC-2 type transport system permease protein
VIATMHSELLKLRTVRVHTVMLVIAAAFPILIVLLVTALTSSPGTFDGRDLAELVTGVTLVAVLLLATVAAISLTGEYSHGTIRPTFAATPSHGRVFGAKLLVNSIAVATVVAAVIAISWLLGALVLSGRDASVTVSMADGTAGSMIAMVVLSVVVSWFALGIGLVLRNAPATVTLLLVWPLLIENLLSGIAFLVGFEGLSRWMPFQASILASTPAPGADALGRPWAFVWFGAVSLALVGIGMLLDRHRDA